MTEHEYNILLQGQHRTRRLAYVLWCVVVAFLPWILYHAVCAHANTQAILDHLESQPPAEASVEPLEERKGEDDIRGKVR